VKFYSVCFKYQVSVIKVCLIKNLKFSSVWLVGSWFWGVGTDDDDDYTTGTTTTTTTTVHCDDCGMYSLHHWLDTVTTNHLCYMYW
jgi:hypothetical protein